MKTVTIDDILSWHPCFEYSRERIEELMNGRSSISALEIMDLNINAADRLWAVLRELFFTSYDLYFLAAAFAERQLGIWERVYPNDLRPRYAIQAARLYAMGEIGLDELSAARGAARGAARDTACAAADAAARATDAAAWGTAQAAFRAADAAEYKKQIEIVRQYLIQKGVEE